MAASGSTVMEERLLPALLSDLAGVFSVIAGFRLRTGELAEVEGVGPPAVAIGLAGRGTHARRVAEMP